MHRYSYWHLQMKALSYFASLYLCTKFLLFLVTLNIALIYFVFSFNFADKCPNFSVEGPI